MSPLLIILVILFVASVLPFIVLAIVAWRDRHDKYPDGWR